MNYYFVVIGQFHRAALHRILESETNFVACGGQVDGFDYIFETTTGTIYLEIGYTPRNDERPLLVSKGILPEIDEKKEDYVDGFYCEINLATDPHTIGDFVTWLDKLAQTHRFMILVSNAIIYSLFVEEYAPDTRSIVEYTELQERYTKVYQRRHAELGAG